MLPSVIGTIGSVPSSRAGPLRLNAAPIHSDINSRKQIGSESELVSVGPCEKYAMGFNGAVEVPLCK
jgi:hypothetical protein